MSRTRGLKPALDQTSPPTPLLHKERGAGRFRGPERRSIAVSQHSGWLMFIPHPWQMSGRGNIPPELPRPVIPSRTGVFSLVYAEVRKAPATPNAPRVGVARRINRLSMRGGANPNFAPLSPRHL
jgi:hypothetical protein